MVLFDCWLSWVVVGVMGCCFVLLMVCYCLFELFVGYIGEYFVFYMIGLLFNFLLIVMLLVLFMICINGNFYVCDIYLVDLC